MGASITIVGGGSYHWAPQLLADFANTPSLNDVHVVLHDLDAERMKLMQDLGSEIAARRGIAMTVEAEGDRRRALEGADFVITALSVGGFDSMQHDIEIPQRYGIRQPIGDSVGPGGIMRALRNIPVLVGIARDMQELCDDAWLLNLTNPMTALCRAVTRETNVQCVGLCHEITGAQYALSNLFDEDFRSFDFDVVGVNHLPIFTALRIDGEDAFPKLRELLADPQRLRNEPIHLPPGLDPDIVALAAEFKKADLVEQHRVKFALFERFGVLP
ncbi:MAG: hypothetical protein M3Q30_21670, partial [Actinomycetota bacterium]|nr:hypothetical protein [Actinomycetota bacterium]